MLLNGIGDLNAMRGDAHSPHDYSRMIHKVPILLSRTDEERYPSAGYLFPTGPYNPNKLGMEFV